MCCHETVYQEIVWSVRLQTLDIHELHIKEDMEPQRSHRGTITILIKAIAALIKTLLNLFYTTERGIEILQCLLLMS